MKAISEALVQAVCYIAGAPAESDERENADVSMLEQIGVILQRVSAAERAALRAAVSDAIAAEQKSTAPNNRILQNYEAFITSYLSE